MDFTEYQRATAGTAIYPDANSGTANAVNYCVLGLAGEAGEIPNKWKKSYRDGLLLNDLRQPMLEELGDVLWYASQLATELNVSLELVAEKNIEKLLGRKERGVLGGSGDHR